MAAVSKLIDQSDKSCPDHEQWPSLLDYTPATFMPKKRVRKGKGGNKTTRKAKSRKQRNKKGPRTKTNPLIKFLREKISRLNYGVNVADIGVRPELEKFRLTTRYNYYRYGAALRNAQYLEHFAGDRTYYYWSDHRSSTPEILVMIDVDCEGSHGGGSTQGALRFITLVRDRLFPGLYFEPSTHGKGFHGYFILEKPWIKVDLVRTVLKQLDHYLKRLAASVSADIACVEVKGLPPRIDYDDNGNIIDITFGQFAKLPRGQGVLQTCKVTHGKLALLDPDEIKVEPQPQRIIVEKNINKPPGSFDSRVVRQDVLDLLPTLEEYASKLLVQWTGATSIKADRWTVTAMDLAQFFALMLCMKPKADDSLPVRAIGRLWEEVYLAGDFSRSWNHHRFKAIRDLLSQHGHIDWLDYRFQYISEQKGRCCRWQISELLRSVLDSLRGEATVVDTTAPLLDGPHEYHTPQWFNFTWDQHLRWWEEAEDKLELLFAA